MASLKSMRSVEFNHNFMADSAGDIHDHYKMAKKNLGEGSYGVVLIGKSKESGEERAVKSIQRSKIKDKSTFQAEVDIQKQLDHPNIVKLYEVYEDPRAVYLVMELCTGGELFDRIVEQAEAGDGAAFNEKAAAVYMRQIMRAMVYIHSKDFVHRDIKPENFLLENRKQDAEIKVIDFGLAKKFKIGSGETMKTKAGTPYYVAPQVLQGSYNEKCDVWSCGVIMYILLCGYPPFYGDKDQDILRRVRRGTFDFPADDWDGISNENGAKALIMAMLTMDPAKRPSAADVLEHPWFKQELTATSGPSIQADFSKRLKGFRNGAKLKKVALTLIATQLPQKDIKALKETFEAMDTDNNGTLTVTEITEAMTKQGLPVGEELKGIIEKLDTDGSGTIEYSEFIAATITQKEYYKEEVLWSAFRVFDKDGDGQITKEELEKVLNHSQVNDDVAKMMIAEVDVDGDGKLSFDEFVQMMKKDDGY